MLLEIIRSNRINLSWRQLVLNNEEIFTDNFNPIKKGLVQTDINWLLS